MIFLCSGRNVHFFRDLPAKCFEEKAKARFFGSIGSSIDCGFAKILLLTNILRTGDKKWPQSVGSTTCKGEKISHCLSMTFVAYILLLQSVVAVIFLHSWSKRTKKHELQYYNKHCSLLIRPKDLVHDVFEHPLIVSLIDVKERADNLMVSDPGYWLNTGRELSKN
jgi:hypothetical protein